MVYVVDSAARSRTEENREQIRLLRGHLDLKKKPVLFFLNKKDLPDAVEELAFTQEMDLHSMANDNKTSVNVVSSSRIEYNGIELVENNSIEWHT